MISHFGNAAVFQKDDKVRILDCGKAVGNDEGGTVFSNFQHSITDALLGYGINRTGSFI